MPFPFLLLSPLLDIASKVIDRVVPDKAAAEKAKLEMASVEMSQEFQTTLAQIQTNLEEAKSPNWFVAGWRPFVGWSCGAAFVYVALFEPFIRFVATVVFHYEGIYPNIDTTITMQVLLGMLGLGAMRTYEKYKDAEGNR